tara:strand:- start:108396 stop:108686 length:291 start_codon:yes stop_codon:yes gene_type:complete
MQKKDEQLHYDAMQRLIELANKLAAEGMPPRVVSAGLMTASCVYATYTEVGNKGSLTEAGIDRIANGYRKHLADNQKNRQENVQPSADEKLDDAVD